MRNWSRLETTLSFKRYVRSRRLHRYALSLMKWAAKRFSERENRNTIMRNGTRLDISMKGQYMNELTLGSLFDGSGSFPFGGKLVGIKPVWASEVEPFPILVTKTRMPDVQHLGNICKLNGADIPPVDIITFGSPCQDVSIAGKRAGLDGSRSSLFYEAIRVIKEMRCATHGKYPRYIVWENVAGAFSSNKGKDFNSVLTAICSIKETGEVSIPMPKNHKWLNSGEIVGNNYSVAWRLLNAQYWGVAQRRRRIYLGLSVNPSVTS